MPGPLDPDLYLLRYLSNGRNHVNTLVLVFGIYHNLLKMLDFKWIGELTTK
jgi:hypothetical protein